MIIARTTLIALALAALVSARVTEEEITQVYSTAIETFDNVKGSNDFIDRDEWDAAKTALSVPDTIDFGDVAGTDNAVSREELVALAVFLAASGGDGTVDAEEYKAFKATPLGQAWAGLPAYIGEALGWPAFRDMAVVEQIRIAAAGDNGVIDNESEWATALAALGAHYGADLSPEVLVFAAAAGLEGVVDGFAFQKVAEFVRLGGADGIVTREEWRAAGRTDHTYGTIIGIHDTAMCLADFVDSAKFKRYASNGMNIDRHEWKNNNVPGTYTSAARGKKNVNHLAWMTYRRDLRRG